MSYQIYGRRVTSPVRFTLTSTLGSGLDGAWWPHTLSIARELSDLTSRYPGAYLIPLRLRLALSTTWRVIRGHEAPRPSAAGNASPAEK